MFKFLAAVLALCPSVAFGDYFLSGDSNNVLAIDGSYGPLPNGNARFFTNLLGGGKSVELHAGGNGTSVAQLNNLYNSLTGVHSVIAPGPISTLAGVSLLVIDLPDVVLTVAEAAVVKQFEAAGGNVLVIGENSTIANAGVINADLAAIGTVLRLVPTVADGGVRIATVADGQILADPVNAGVDNYVYGGLGVSLISGGKPILLTADRSASIFSVERPALATVPEPSTLFLTSIGLAAFGWRASGPRRGRRGSRARDWSRASTPADK